MTITLPFSEEAAAPSMSLYQGYPVEALRETTEAIDALNVMLQDMFARGDIVPEPTARGIRNLLDSQVRILAASTNQVVKDLAARDEEMENAALSADAMALRREVIRKSLDAGADPATLSKAINLPRSAIARVVRTLRGEAPEQAAATA